MQVNGDPTDTKRSFVRFNLSSIPAGSTVTSATLTLCFASAPTGGAVGRTHELRLVTSAWTETGVTWTSQPTASGGTTDAEVVTSGPSCVDFSVTPDVQAWVSGSANYGWRVNDQDELTSGDSTAEYSTREEPAQGQRPRLRVLYTAP